MTEKRFSYEIEHFKEELGQYNRSGLVKLLLMMKEENKQLKQSHKELGTAYDELVKLGNILEKENEQLKSELKALRKKYNDFSDMVEQRLKEMDMGLVK